MASKDAEPVLLRRNFFTPLIALLVPFILYAVIAIVTSVNIPLQDDFDSIGMLVEHFADLHSVWAKVQWILTAQHVQYKLIFLQTIAALQYVVTGNTNYRTLQLLGDLSMPAIVLLLWLIFSRGNRPVPQRLWLFTPVPCIILAVRYWESVNWAMSGLQNMAVIPFALATLYFATQNRRRSFAITVLFLLLTISASGNGFFLSAVLLCTSRSRSVGSATRLLHSASRSSWRLSMRFTIRFTALNGPSHSPLQSEALRSIRLRSLGTPRIPHLCRASGAGAYCWLCLSRRPWLASCLPGLVRGCALCVVTAAGVTAARYRYGPSGALFGHYAMYSLLLIALEYIAVVRLFVPRVVPLRSRMGVALASAALLSFVFCLFADAQGYRNLHGRKRQLVAHLILWERHPDHLVLVPDEVMFAPETDWVPLRTAFQNILQSEISKGLYRPPYAASDPLPVRPHSPATIGIEDETPPARAADQ